MQVIPAIFGHRGACGYRPENTIESFELAFAQGVAAVECDLIPTKDGKLVVLHDADLSSTTTVAELPQFADRRRILHLPWRDIDGWFVQDFTLDEIRLLRAKERLPEERAGSAKFDGHFKIPTLDEFLNADFAKPGTTLILEVKFAWLFKTAGLDSGALLVEALLNSDWRERGLKLVIETFFSIVLLAIGLLTNQIVSLGSFSACKSLAFFKSKLQYLHPAITSICISPRAIFNSLLILDNKCHTINQT
jgi:glycerophosphoryl diester phosphodiesterase